MNEALAALKEQIEGMEIGKQMIVSSTAYANNTVQNYACVIGKKLGRKYRTKRLHTGCIVIYRAS